MTNSVEEALLFWEYAEDFRRGHPHSDQPFRHIEQLPLNTAEDAAAVNALAEGLYFAFVRLNAPYQVSHFGELEVPRVLRGLWAAAQRLAVAEEAAEEGAAAAAAAVGASLADCVVPRDIFVPLQRAVFAVLRDDYLPAFQAHRDFRRILAASVHATERVRRCLSCSLASCAVRYRACADGPLRPWIVCRRKRVKS